MNTTATVNSNIPRTTRNMINQKNSSMTYVLEKITPEDQEKILRDAACDPEKQEILSSGFRVGEPHVSTRLIDRERDCYSLISHALFGWMRKTTGSIFSSRDVCTKSVS